METLGYNIVWTAILCGSVLTTLTFLYWLAFIAYPWARRQTEDWLETRRVLRRSRLLGKYGRWWK